MNKNEAFSRIVIDAMLATQGRNRTDPHVVRFEALMPDRASTDFALSNCTMRSLAVIEGKWYSVTPLDAIGPAKRNFAPHLDVPNFFLAKIGERLAPDGNKLLIDPVAYSFCVSRAVSSAAMAPVRTTSKRSSD